MKRPIIHVISQNQRSSIFVSSKAIEIEPTCEIVEHATHQSFRDAVNSGDEAPWQVAVTDQPGLVNVRTGKGQLVPVVLFSNHEHPSERAGALSVMEIKPHLEEAIFTATLFQKLAMGVDRLAELNDRERSIVSLAADGIPNKSIARRLNVSIKTIEQCRRNAYHKLGIKSSAEVGSLVTFGRFYSLMKSPAGGASVPATS